MNATATVPDSPSAAPAAPPFPRCVAITGGAGFLGRHLVERLRARHPATSVRVVDIKSYRPPDLREDVEYFGSVDILEPSELLPAFEGADAVVHLAGIVSHWNADRARLFSVNKEGTRNVLLTCAYAGVRRLVHVSTATTIGYTNEPGNPADESLVFDWNSVVEKPFMNSKLAAELQLKDAHKFNVSVIIANPASIYGPGDARRTHRQFQAVQAGTIRAVSPGGKNVVDVRDVADGLCRMLWSAAGNGRFILGGENLTFAQINAAIAAELGAAATSLTIPRALRAPLCAAVRWAERFPSRPIKVAADDFESRFAYRYYSSAKAERQLGWKRRYTFEQTVRDAAADLVKRGLLKPFVGSRAIAGS